MDYTHFGRSGLKVSGLALDTDALARLDEISPGRKNAPEDDAR